MPGISTPPYDTDPIARSLWRRSQERLAAYGLSCYRRDLAAHIKKGEARRPSLHPGPVSPGLVSALGKPILTD